MTTPDTARLAMIRSASWIPADSTTWATMSCGNQDRCHILADNYRDADSSGRFDDSVRLRLDSDDLEFGVDFQAFVADVAGKHRLFRL